MNIFASLHNCHHASEWVDRMQLGPKTEPAIAARRVRDLFRLISIHWNNIFQCVNRRAMCLSNYLFADRCQTAQVEVENQKGRRSIFWGNIFPFWCFRYLPEALITSHLEQKAALEWASAPRWPTLLRLFFFLSADGRGLFFLEEKKLKAN